MALLTVCHEHSSGASLIPEVGAMYGPNAVSETSLIGRNLLRLPLRNLKVVLNTENIRARSEDTFMKDLLASVVSYNLVTQFRCRAAELAEQSPRRMSFKCTWTTFNTFLLSSVFTDAAQWRKQYRIVLSYATLDKLPNRSHRRFQREAYPARPKSNQFKKRTRNSKPDD